MTLTPGTRLGPYEVIAAIGAAPHESEPGLRVTLNWNPPTGVKP